MTTSTSTSKYLWLAALLLSGCPAVLTPDPLEPMPQILSFTGSAAEVPSGGSLTLSWRVENATAVTIEELSLGKLSGIEGLEGTVDVSVSTNALFVLTARNARGATDSAVVSVQVQGQPTELLFVASESSIEAGRAVTLAWSAPGATNVAITGAPGGAVDLAGQTASGAVVVRPGSTTTYSINAGGRTATVEVKVSGSITSFTASPTVASANEPVTISWTTLNAERVQLLAPGRPALVDTTDAAQVASGTFMETLPAVVDPGHLFTYELRVTSGAVTLTRTVMITIEGTPSIVSFTAPDVAKRDVGQDLTLSWVTASTDSVSITANGVEIYRSPTRAIALAGATTLPVPRVDTTYVLTAASARGGAVTATHTVDSLGVPTVSLTATPQSLAGGDVVTLTWSGSEIRAVNIASSTTAGTVLVRRGVLDTGTTSVRVNGDAVFTITADNSLGDVATATAAVTVTSPVTLSVVDTGALRSGQTVGVTASIPGELTGLPHQNVVARSGSAGFIDIEPTGTQVVMSTGNILGTINSSFRTVLFGRTVGQDIRVSRYGYLVFGQYLNGSNTVDEALPTAKLEPMAVAPYWEGTSGTVYWEVRTAGGASTLIVQWNSSTIVAQAKISSTGQIDFEYQTLPTTVNGKAGITGPTRAHALVAPTPAVGTSVTFFGPMSQPVQVPVFEAGRISGTLSNAAGQPIRAETTVANVVARDELLITEVLPRSPAGQGAQWLELTNWRQQPVDLTGWSLTFSDGGVAPLTATIPARGTLVLGASTDPALNDDAGVQVAVPGFDLGGRTVALSRAGDQQVFSWGLSDGGFAVDAGTSLTFEPGPVLSAPGVPAQGPLCFSSGTFGSLAPQQFGTPGADVGCGFPYAKSTIAPGYYDIASPAYALAFVNEDDAVTSMSLVAAPVPFFGVTKTSLDVSTNGFVSFEENTTLPSHQFAVNTPQTNDANAVLAIFADNLQGNRATFPDSNVYARRMGQGEDPFAAAPHWIIQWHHFSQFIATVNSRGDFNFQIKLFDDGVIEYHFGEMRSGPVSTHQASGITAVTWLEAPGGTSALAINVNSTNPGIFPHSAFRFTPRGSP
jgi:hypothetical protein